MTEDAKRDMWADPPSDDDPHEKWFDIEDFPDYAVSSNGRVRNNSTGRIMALTQNQFGVVKVGMVKDGKQWHRGVAHLVAKHHLEAPPDGLVFDTPINLDGDRFNNRVENLMWRPRWFALKYHAQFAPDARKGFKTPIQVLSTGDIFPNSMSAAIQYGILAEDTVKSVLHNQYVFPTFQKFKLLDDESQKEDSDG